MKKRTLDPAGLRVDTFETAPSLAAPTIPTVVGQPTCNTCGNPPRMDDDDGAFRTTFKCCV